MIIGVLGGDGFVGTQLQKTCTERQDVEVVSITRENYETYVGSHFDVFINSAGNKRAFWANQHPYEDFKIATSVVYRALFDFSADKYVFLSSIAVYDEPSHYGFNKRLSEQIVQRHAKNYLILRPCNIIDNTITIGLLADIKNGTPLFVTPNSKMQFITRIDFVRIMLELIEQESMCINIGGIGSVTIDELQDIVGRKAIIQDAAKYREYEMDVSELAKRTPLKTSREYVIDVERS